MKTFLVTYQLEDDAHVRTDEIEAEDEACALGCVLDGLEDDEDGDPPALAFVTIQSPNVVLPMSALPGAILDAYQRGLGDLGG